MGDSSGIDLAGKRVFVTGASGLVGSRLVRTLCERGCAVTGYADAEAALPAAVSLVRGDVTDLARLAAELARADAEVVFHLAADNDNASAAAAPLDIFDVNIRGTWNLLDACRGLERLQGVVVCSSAEAGDPAGEAGSTPRLAPYAVSKHAAELISKVYATSYELPVAVARFENVYGGGDRNWNRLIPSCMKACLGGSEPTLRGGPDVRRDYLYVEDAVEALAATAARCRHPGVQGHVFHFGTGELTSKTEVASKICALAGIVPSFDAQGAPREDERRSVPYDGTQEAERLGWRSRTAIDDGLRRTFEWYKDNPDAWC